jgi:hypothetical protein
MNTKLRNDSTFAQLTSEQTELLEDWLFEEKLGYQEVIAKMQQEFGIKTSQTALGRFFRRLANERAEEERLETIAAGWEKLAVPNDGTLLSGLLALADQRAVGLLVEPPKSIREFTALLRALTSAHAQEMKWIEFREAKAARRRQLVEHAEQEAQRQEKEAKERERNRRWSEEYNAYWDAVTAKRKATLAAKAAAKKAEEEAKQAALRNLPSPMVKQDEPPSKATADKEVGAPETERRLEAGLTATKAPEDSKSSPANAVSEPAPVVSLEIPPASGITSLDGTDGLARIERKGDLTINWAGNPR